MAAFMVCFVIVISVLSFVFGYAVAANKYSDWIR